MFPIHIPALRERGEDILLLAEHFRLLISERLGKASEPFAGEVNQTLLTYAYPGNVRTEAARLLGISRYHLLRRMQKFGLGSDHDDKGPGQDL